MITRGRWCFLLGVALGGLVVLVAVGTDLRGQEKPGPRQGARQSVAPAKTQPAPGVFLPELPPSLNDRVKELAKRIPPVDKATAQAIQTQIRALGLRHKFVKAWGQEKVAAYSVARAKLRGIGKPAIPSLIAATTDSNRQVRQHALAAIFGISKSTDEAFAYLPVFVRSMWDKDPEVRSGSAAQVGQVAAHLRRQFRKTVSHLERALKDKDPGVQSTAGRCLLRVGEGDRVPKDLREKLKGWQ